MIIGKDQTDLCLLLVHMPSRVKKGLSGRGRGRPPKNIKDDEENGNEKGLKATKTSEKVVTGKKRGRPTGGSKKVAKKIKTSPKKSKRVSSDMESHHSDSDSEKVIIESNSGEDSEDKDE